MDIEAYIKKIVSYLVDDMEKVDISVTECKKMTIIELEVSKEDTGKIIGKNGKTANAIRTLLSAIGSKNNRKYNFEIIDK